MSKKILIFSVLAVGIFGLVGSAFAEAVCVRDPAGETIYNQDTLNFDCTGLVWTDLCDYGALPADCLYQQFWIGPGPFCSTPGVAGSTFSFSDDLGVFVGSMQQAYVAGSITDEVDAQGCFLNYVQPATDGVQFDVLEGSTLPGDWQEAITASIGTIKTDIWDLLTENIPTILLVVGALLGLFIVVRSVKRLVSR